MREDLGIVVNSSTSAALGYAIFTENSVNLVDAATLQTERQLLTSTPADRSPAQTDREHRQPGHPICARIVLSARARSEGT